MIMGCFKKLNLIHDLGEMNYYEYIPLPSITYGLTGIHNMSFKTKQNKTKKRKNPFCAEVL